MSIPCLNPFPSYKRGFNIETTSSLLILSLYKLLHKNSLLVKLFGTEISQILAQVVHTVLTQNLLSKFVLLHRG